MANEASYVPQGRDNTGAAIQLNPFDSSQIWAAYDKANAPVKKPILDSYGKPLGTGKDAVDPRDRPYLQAKEGNYLKRYTEIVQKSKAENRDVTAEENMELSALKNDYIDSVSVAQFHLKDRNEMLKAIRSNPYAFKKGAAQKVEEWFSLPFDQRMQQPLDVSKAPAKDGHGWITKFKPTSSGSGGHTNADGSSSTYNYKRFDPVKAEKYFAESILPYVVNPITEEQQIFRATIQDEIETQAKAQGMIFEEMPAEQQANLVLDVAKAEAFSIWQGATEEKGGGTTKDAPIDKDGSTGSKSGGSNGGLEVRVGTTYKKFNPKTGTVVPEGSDQSGDTEAINVMTIPLVGRVNNASDKGAGENKKIQLKLVDGTYKPVLVKNISKYANTSNKWEEGLWITYADEDGQLIEMPLDSDNQHIVEKEFAFSVNDFLNKKYKGWKDQADNKEIVAPEKLPRWSQMSTDEKNAYLAAYARKTKTRFTPLEPTEEEKKAKETEKEKADKKKSYIQKAKDYFKSSPKKSDDLKDLF